MDMNTHFTVYNLCFILASHLPHGKQLPTFLMATSTFIYPFLLKNVSSCTPWMACWRFCLLLSWLTACSFLFLFFLLYLGLMFFWPNLSVSTCDPFLHRCLAVECFPAVPSSCGFCNVCLSCSPFESSVYLLRRLNLLSHLKPVLPTPPISPM